MRKIHTAALAAGVMVTGMAHAVSPATTTFPVTATVAPACTATATALAFGNYTPGGGAVAQTSTVSAKCTVGTKPVISLNGGSTAGGTVAQRLMAQTGQTTTLQYQMYTSNSATPVIWGDGSGTSVTQTVTGTGIGNAVALTVYGSIPDNATNQAAIPGAYADTVTVTLTF